MITLIHVISTPRAGKAFEQDNGLARSGEALDVPLYIADQTWQKRIRQKVSCNKQYPFSSQ